MGSRAKARTKTGKRGRTSKNTGDTRDLTTRHAGQVKGGKSVPADFNFVHRYDKASPTLAS